MRLNRKLVKVTLTCGLLSSVFQAATCEVSPEVATALTNALVTRLEEGGSFRFGGFVRSEGPKHDEEGGRDEKGGDEGGQDEKD